MPALRIMHNWFKGYLWRIFSIHIHQIYKYMVKIKYLNAHCKYVTLTYILTSESDIHLIYGPLHAKMCLRAYVDSKGPDQPVHSLIRTQSDQDLYCPQTESLDNIDCISGDQRPRWDFAHVQDDLNLHIFCMFEENFCLTCPLCVLNSQCSS